MIFDIEHMNKRSYDKFNILCDGYRVNRFRRFLGIFGGSGDIKSFDDI